VGHGGMDATECLETSVAASPADVHARFDNR
jgi:hypothetical protein